MKKSILLIASLFIIATAQAQTYQKIETTHFDKSGAISSKLVKYKSGTIQIGESFINIEGVKSLTIVSKGKAEAQDEGYTASEYVCITETKAGNLKALKVVLFYTPKRELCDLIVKNGKTNTDYCITDK